MTEPAQVRRVGPLHRPLSKVNWNSPEHKLPTRYDNNGLALEGGAVISDGKVSVVSDRIDLRILNRPVIHQDNTQRLYIKSSMVLGIVHNTFEC